jgi:hypothetical protein
MIVRQDSEFAYGFQPGYINEPLDQKLDLEERIWIFKG